LRAWPPQFLKSGILCVGGVFHLAPTTSHCFPPFFCVFKDFGFDPLGLGTDPERLKWYAEAEKTNGRWAMAAVAGILFTELLGKPKWFEAGAEVRKAGRLAGRWRPRRGCACGGGGVATSHAQSALLWQEIL
jgi:hypothetical protein